MTRKNKKTKKQKNKKTKKPNRCGGIEWFLIYFDGQHFLGEAIFFQIYLFLLWLGSKENKCARIG